MNQTEQLSLLHDGHLRSIEWQSSGNVVLLCSDVRGASVVITLTNVESFCANNFRNGNIILDVCVHGSMEELDDNAVAMLAYSDRPERVSQYRARWQTRVAGGEARLLVLEASYGCEAVALVKGEIVVANREVEASSGSAHGAAALAPSEREPPQRDGA